MEDENSVNNDVPTPTAYYETESEASPLVGGMNGSVKKRRRPKKKPWCSCDLGDYIKSILFGGLDGISTGMYASVGSNFCLLTDTCTTTSVRLSCYNCKYINWACSNVLCVDHWSGKVDQWSN